MRRDTRVPNLLDHLANRRRIEATLASGLHVTYHLPDARRCLIAAESLDLHGMGEGPARLQRAWFYGRQLLADALEGADGLDAEGDRAAVVEMMSEPDRIELLHAIDAAGAVEKTVAADEPEDWQQAAQANVAKWQDALARAPA
jgi:hypothetical protein